MQLLRFRCLFAFVGLLTTRVYGDDVKDEYQYQPRPAPPPDAEGNRYWWQKVKPFSKPDQESYDSISLSEDRKSLELQLELQKTKFSSTAQELLFTKAQRETAESTLELLLTKQRVAELEEEVKKQREAIMDYNKQILELKEKDLYDANIFVDLIPVAGNRVTDGMVVKGFPREEHDSRYAARKPHSIPRRFRNKDPKRRSDKRRSWYGRRWYSF
ncbi:unnamed protein product [Cyprideis torosa]|uniref:Uncharacterized protein n=1 Tax=Cyprideis torosa TaxID=163714 RepID=A0A7R8ZIG3_9CRUS|nr:unnamed protein product [Cyprideis torosa]CAG0884734.1 unnamed protein product [Cyprideis torosa]